MHRVSTYYNGLGVGCGDFFRSVPYVQILFFSNCFYFPALRLVKKILTGVDILVKNY